MKNLCIFNVNSKNHQHLSSEMKHHVGIYQKQLPKEKKSDMNFNLQRELFQVCLVSE